MQFHLRKGYDPQYEVAAEIVRSCYFVDRFHLTHRDDPRITTKSLAALLFRLPEAWVINDQSEVVHFQV